MAVETVPMQVKLLGYTYTCFDLEGDENELSLCGMEVGSYSKGADDLAEFAGRSCYQSFHKPNPATRENKEYLENIIRQGHESVLEHATATFYITGVSRALTHELIRHRHLSYSQLSQRFVDEGRRLIVVPPAMQGTTTQLFLENQADEAFDAYEEMVEQLKDKGYSRKQAREAARAVLPNCTETRIVVSGNMRAFRDVLKRRLDPSADAEIRELATMLLLRLVEFAPNSFQDLKHYLDTGA